MQYLIKFLVVTGMFSASLSGATFAIGAENPMWMKNVFCKSWGSYRVCYRQAHLCINTKKAGCLMPGQCVYILKGQIADNSRCVASVPRKRAGQNVQWIWESGRKMTLTYRDNGTVSHVNGMYARPDTRRGCHLLPISNEVMCLGRYTPM
ncbi:MAG: hypothetical protein JKY49_09205 [Cohaesibacteraceae bacterium]|nr:hypothetical protein [Cohaesibacteraceae bacterium]